MNINPALKKTDTKGQISETLETANTNFDIKIKKCCMVANRKTRFQDTKMTQKLAIIGHRNQPNRPGKTKGMIYVKKKE